MAPAPARGNQQVLPQVPGKVLQHRMRLARGIHGLPETAAQALDGFGNGPDALLRAVRAAPRVLAQELQDLLPLPPRLRLHRLACPRVRQHGLKLTRLAAQAPDHLDRKSTRPNSSNLA